MGFSVDGKMLYSAGSDGWVKAASSETGRVEVKIAVPRAQKGYVFPWIYALDMRTVHRMRTPLYFRVGIEQS